MNCICLRTTELCSAKLVFIGFSVLLRNIRRTTGFGEKENQSTGKEENWAIWYVSEDLILKWWFLNHVLVRRSMKRPSSDFVEWYNWIFVQLFFFFFFLLSDLGLFRSKINNLYVPRCYLVGYSNMVRPVKSFSQSLFLAYKNTGH